VTRSKVTQADVEASARHSIDPYSFVLFASLTGGNDSIMLSEKDTIPLLRSFQKILGVPNTVPGMAVLPINALSGKYSSFLFCSAPSDGTQAAAMKHLLFLDPLLRLADPAAGIPVSTAEGLVRVRLEGSPNGALRLFALYTAVPRPHKDLLELVYRQKEPGRISCAPFGGAHAALLGVISVYAVGSSATVAPSNATATANLPRLPDVTSTGRGWLALRGPQLTKERYESIPAEVHGLPGSKVDFLAVSANSSNTPRAYLCFDPACPVGTPHISNSIFHWACGRPRLRPELGGGSGDVAAHRLCVAGGRQPVDRAAREGHSRHRHRQDQGCAGAGAVAGGGYPVQGRSACASPAPGGLGGEVIANPATVSSQGSMWLRISSASVRGRGLRA
jgi:hypothetical protein